MRTLVTGYAGFIGSNLTRMLLDQCDEGDEILGVDCLTYAARPLWVWQYLNDEDSRFTDARIDIREPRHLLAVIEKFKPDRVYHLAAESHVCRSIEGPVDFATTNFMGTFNLLEALRKTNFKGRLVHVSTDEAFGQLEMDDPAFSEHTLIKPTSPYSASKAASDLMVGAYVHTYGLNACITRCTNNFGPNQHEEKLIPGTIRRLMERKPIILYGDGSHKRDWIFVDEHCKALITVMEEGERGELYCVGSGFEKSNLEIAQRVAAAFSELSRQSHNWTIQFIDGRPSDDKRYAVDNRKLKALGWGIDSGPAYFHQRLKQTVEWYLSEMA